jgi:hypothetical protein
MVMFALFAYVMRPMATLMDLCFMTRKLKMLSNHNVTSLFVNSSFFRAGPLITVMRPTAS